MKTPRFPAVQVVPVALVLGQGQCLDTPPVVTPEEALAEDMAPISAVSEATARRAEVAFTNNGREVRLILPEECKKDGLKVVVWTAEEVPPAPTFSEGMSIYGNFFPGSSLVGDVGRVEIFPGGGFVWGIWANFRFEWDGLSITEKSGWECHDALFGKDCATDFATNAGLIERIDSRLLCTSDGPAYGRLSDPGDVVAVNRGECPELWATQTARAKTFFGTFDCDDNGQPFLSIPSLSKFTE